MLTITVDFSMEHDGRDTPPPSDVL